MAHVTAIVLTYNRKDLLSRCLSAIVEQTRAPDEVIVVDNCSTDGTLDMLREEWIDRVQAFALSRNIGAAGGFSAGFRLAYARGADFVWVMDDDVIPEKGALEALLAAEDLLTARKVPHAFVTSNVRAPNGDSMNVPNVDGRLNDIDFPYWSSFLDEKLVAVRRATFVSILISRATMNEHGLPLAPMFIWGEDTEYTLRATQTRPGYLAGDSKVVHMRSLVGHLRLETETNPARMQYHSHRLRNDLYLLAKQGERRRLMRRVMRTAAMIARFGVSGDFEKARILARGLFWSLSFDPPIEKADAPMESLGVTATPLRPDVDVARPARVERTGGERPQSVRPDPAQPALTPALA